MKKSEKRQKLLKSKNSTLILLLAVMTLFFWLFSPNHSFLSIRNVTSILNSMTIQALFVVAEALLIIMGELDLSPGYVGTACGALMANLLAGTSLPWFVVVIICLFFGAAFGFLNALLQRQGSAAAYISAAETERLPGLPD